MRTTLLIGFVLFLATPLAHAQTGPDVIVGQLNGVANYASTPTPIGAIEAFSVGTTSCNVGDTILQWQASSSEHPVIGQNLYKLSSGILTQVGQSWLKHGFCALSQTLCGPCASTPCDTLGIGCSDPYTAVRNGTQSTLGPRSQVNPSTGEFPYPFVASPPPTNIGRRLQVPVSLLESSGDGAQYFVDGQYITFDDTAAGNHMNNVSICPVTLVGAGANWSATMNPAQTIAERTVIEHWATLDPSVLLESIETDGGFGRIWVASTVTESNGVFHYEYAAYNENSHDSVGAFAVTIPNGLVIDSSDSFHAVHHHSGSGASVLPGVDPIHLPFGDAGYHNEAWILTETPGSGLAWSTSSTAEPANPIRWGTMYNFRFKTNAPPVAGNAALTTWRTGQVHSVTVLRPTDDFVPAVIDLQCEYDLVADAATVTWVNAGIYSEIQLFRDSQLIASLPGDVQSVVDDLATPGSHDYTVVAVDAGEISAEVSCEMVVPSQTYNFSYRFSATTLFFDAATGIGSAQTEITVAEDRDNPGFPNDVAGFSMAFTYDASLVAVSEVSPAEPLAGLDPDFFEVSILEESGVATGGVTVGVVIDFLVAPPLLIAASETAVVTIDIDTIPTAAASTISEVYFEDGVHGPIPISNVVTVNLQSFIALTVPGQITLESATSSTFRRGDSNLDGVLDLADAIFDLSYQMAGGPAMCLSAHDADNDGNIDLEDSIFCLTFMFLGGPLLPAPYPSCGVDSTPDGLTCETSNCP